MQAEFPGKVMQTEFPGNPERHRVEMKVMFKRANKARRLEKTIWAKNNGKFPMLGMIMLADKTY